MIYIHAIREMCTPSTSPLDALLRGTLPGMTPPTSAPGVTAMSLSQPDMAVPPPNEPVPPASTDTMEPSTTPYPKADLGLVSGRKDCPQDGSTMDMKAGEHVSTDSSKPENDLPGETAAGVGLPAQSAHSSDCPVICPTVADDAMAELDRLHGRPAETSGPEAGDSERASHRGKRCSGKRALRALSGTTAWRPFGCIRAPPT